MKGLKLIIIAFFVIILLILFLMIYPLKNEKVKSPNLIPNKSETKENNNVPESKSNECPILNEDANTGSKIGLIIINKDSEGVCYAREIARNRGWGIIELESSDINYIKNRVRLFKRENNNEFLLIIGDFNEIPLEDTGTQQFGYQIYVTDPQLYGDIDEDGYVDLSVGRIPFSSEALLKNYFDNLEIKGENIFVENYPFSSNVNDLPYEQFTTEEYIESLCLKKELPQLQPQRFRSREQLIEDYKFSSAVILNTHGYDKGFIINTEEEFRNQQAHQIDMDDLCGIQSEDCFINRPIFLHFTCLNARELGIEMIKKGASTFAGHYNTAGYTPPGFLSELAIGTPIGTVMKNQGNKKLSHNLAIKINGAENRKRETINIINENIQLFDDYGAILYGDPSLTINIQKESSENVNVIEDENRKIVIVKVNKNPEFIIDPEHGEEYYGVICYNSAYLNSLRATFKSEWEGLYGSPHMATFVIPIKDDSINEINSVKIKVGGEYKDNYDESINYYLFKANKQFLYLDIGNDYPFIPSNEDLEIQFYYS